MALTTFSGPVRSKNGFQNLLPDGTSEAVLQSADKLVTSAQVLALFTTPIEVIPAPGAGKFLQFLGALVFLDYGGTAYASDATEDLVFEYDSGSGVAVSQEADGTIWHATADTLVWVPPVPQSVDFTGPVLAENKNIAVTILVGNWITGNSPLKIRSYYRTITKTSLEGIA